MNNIQMTGIDFQNADVKIRGMFAFPKTQTEALLKKWSKEQQGISFLLLSTCNRTELWAMGEGVDTLNLPALICKEKGLEAKEYITFFRDRKLDEAIHYLFRLACGMESQIFGEDQIITQVKDALNLGREAGSVDAFMDKLFQLAITAAKRIKTEVHIGGNRLSVMNQAMQLIRERKPQPNLSCMVIGNGEMGRLAAQVLYENGYSVMMTVRQYHKGEVRIPFGCQVTAYEDRLSHLPEMDVVVSATASPHHTLHYDAVKPYVEDGKQRIFIDLAVPRDISIRLKNVSGISLYDMDSLGISSEDMYDKDKLTAAEAIIEAYKAEYEKWMDGRRLAPMIEEKGTIAARDTLWRLEPFFKQLDVGENVKEKLKEQIYQAVVKAACKQMFELAKGQGE